MSAHQVRSGYAICTEARSGSNYLCQLLASTGVLGRPLEYFNGPARRALDWPDYPDDPQAQVAQILTRGCTPNGVYGLKLFSAQFDEVAATGWPERLPGLRFIHLEREDVLGQAISLVRATQTQRYRASSPGLAVEPQYDAQAIGRRLAEIVHGQSRWRLYFARNGLSPLRIIYERLCADPGQVVAAVAELVGVPQPRPDASLVEVRVQRDELNERWRRAFLAEASDLKRLDGGLVQDRQRGAWRRARRLLRPR